MSTRNIHVNTASYTLLVAGKKKNTGEEWDVLEFSSLTELKKYRKSHPEKSKRKLTAVCSHQTRIGNLDAHLI